MKTLKEIQTRCEEIEKELEKPVLVVAHNGSDLVIKLEEFFKVEK